MSKHERLLRLVLRVSGAIMLLALPMIFLPRSWMDAFSRWAGMGAFGQAALPEMLARMLSGMYALLGGLLVVLAADVQRYRPVIAYAAVGMIFMGVVIAAAVLTTACPWYWVFTDPVMAAGFGLVILWLLGKVPRPAA